MRSYAQSLVMGIASVRGDMLSVKPCALSSSRSFVGVWCRGTAFFVSMMSVCCLFVSNVEIVHFNQFRDQKTIGIVDVPRVHLV